MKQETTFLRELLQVEKQFQTAVNLQLDYTKIEKIQNYIPTRASVAILKQYLRQVYEDGTEKATILIGPYGKGKSHLLLVLTALLSMERTGTVGDSLKQLKKKIDDVDAEAGYLIDRIWEKKHRFLPVIVSNTSYDLNQAFLVALKEALCHAGLQEMELPSNYEAAEKTIALWKQSYRDTYEAFCREVIQQGKELEVFLSDLSGGSREAYHLFVTLYPQLTSGGVFNPLISSEVHQIYQKVNDVLCEQHGYSGMFLLFDEFSKFIEGHPQDTIAADMKILQDMCELASASKEKQIHLTLVAHKSMKEYGNQLSKQVQNAYRGVEGRLKEILFVTSSQNNYELIQYAIGKKSGYGDFVKENAGLFDGIEAQSREVAGMRNLFPESLFRSVLVEGCYPLLPLTAFLLLKISEQAAQNERTLFTFIAKEEAHSLGEWIQKEQAGTVVTPDWLYDYFAPMFRQDKNLDTAHRQWLAAEYALSQTEDRELQKRIKCMALLLMVQQPEDFPVSAVVLSVAFLCSLSETEEMLQVLTSQEIIRLQRRTGTYVFCNNVGGIHLEEEILQRTEQLERKYERCAFLDEQTSLRYFLPKSYNQKNYITRYYRYVFMEAEAVLCLPSTEALFAQYTADGLLLCVVADTPVNLEQLQRQVNRWQDGRMVVLCPLAEFQGDQMLKRLQAILSLQADHGFIEQNLVLTEELKLLEADCRYELQQYLQEQYAPEGTQTRIFWDSGRTETVSDRLYFQRLLSETMEEYYIYLPKINHELINKRLISPPIRKARQRIMEALLSHQDCTEFIMGTSPESTIYRAVLVRSGLLAGEPEENMAHMQEAILDFLHSAAGHRQPFSRIYEVLEGHPYGIRAGVIPIYLAYMLSIQHAMPCIYLKNKEVPVDASTMQLISEKPEDYSLYVEEQEVSKLAYLNALAQMFWPEAGQNIWNAELRTLAEQMQGWYQGLPQYSRTGTIPAETEEQSLRIKAFRRLFRFGEPNPREWLLEQMPKALDSGDSLEETAIRCRQMKERLETFLPEVKRQLVKEIKTLFGAREEEDLFQTLQMWCLQKEGIWRQKVLSVLSKNFVDCVMNLYTHEETQIVNVLSKALLDLYIESWNDTSKGQYIEKIQQVMAELSEALETDGEAGSSVIFIDENGMQVKKNYTLEEDSSMDFLKNALEDVLEEFGDALTENQRVNVLMELLKAHI